jgi:ribosomal protein RSM22 (predicted rRNA methylase)
MTGLPLALKAGIQEIVHGLSRNEIARRAQSLSIAYRAGGNSHQVSDPLDVAAYLLARMPATYAAMAAALNEVAACAPSFSPGAMLDVGAGPGTASFAAIETWPQIQSVRMLDSNPAMLDAARRLAAAHGHAAVAKPQAITRDIASVTLASADLVIAGYSLAEIAPAQLGAAVASLWGACTGALVLVEPGTPDGFERIRSARALLLESGARLIAPCPHGLACPIVAPDWCHFSQRLPRSRDHMLTKHASVPFEDEKYAYVAAAREGVVLEKYAARIVGPVGRSKTGVTLKLCEDGHIRHAVIPARERDAFARHRRAGWGDGINL